MDDIMFVLSNISKLYDGTSAREEALHYSVDLFIDNGKIREIRPHNPDLLIGSEYSKIDCSRYTVTPGLIDCHGHVTVWGFGSTDLETMNSPAALLYVEKILCTTLVDAGVTTMRDVGGAPHFLKRMVDEGILIGPRLRIAICMLSTTGGHADFRGLDRCPSDISPLWMPGPGRPSSIVDGPWECRKRVREIIACGADLIKICTSPGVASPSDKLEHRDFTGEEIEVICDEAAARGLRVAAHAHSRSGIAAAIKHGAYDIQHISFMDEPLAEQAYAKGCIVTPTSWVMHALLEAEGLSPLVMEKAKQAAEAHMNAVQLAYAGGLKILVGTDPALPRMHGRNYMELVYLIKDGLAPLTAWYGATGLAATEIGQDDAGSLTPGKRADLLICQGDVVETPELLDKGALHEVIKDGIGYRAGLPGVPQKTFSSCAREILERKK
jgi:imidazolonepropionase-like amidohydrolase